MMALDVNCLDASVTRLEFMFESLKESMICTSGNQRFQEQSQKLHINLVNKELDYIQDSLHLLRPRLMYTVASMDAALAAAEKTKERAERMAFENEALMKVFQKKNRDANKRTKKAQNEEAAARILMNLAQKKIEDANKMMKTAQKINAAVLSENQADVTRATLQQNTARMDPHNSNKTVGPIRQVLAQEKSPKIKLDAEVAKRLETNRTPCSQLGGKHMTQLPKITEEFEVTMMKRWDEVCGKFGVGEEDRLISPLKNASIKDLKQARLEKAKLAKSKQSNGPSQEATNKGCLPEVDGVCSPACPVCYDFGMEHPHAV